MLEKQAEDLLCPTVLHQLWNNEGPGWGSAVWSVCPSGKLFWAMAELVKHSVSCWSPWSVLLLAVCLAESGCVGVFTLGLF